MTDQHNRHEPPAPSKDNRREPRVPTRQPVWVEGQDRRVAAEARNMSKGGMFVVSEGAAPAVGTLLQIKFEDPHEGKVELQVEVVWREEATVTSRLGLKVVESEDIAAFERVVGRHYDASHQVRVSSKPPPHEGDGG